MENNLAGSIVYSKNVVEFVTVGVQYCVFLENLEEDTITDVTDKLTKLLPLLYLKASLLPSQEFGIDIFTEQSVSEEDYNVILSKLANIYKAEDTYLEVFLEDMKYSDTPISASISEDLSDIYQDVKNFAAIYEQGIEENMQEALSVCFENFKLYWGQKLTNVLRALHSLKYSIGVDNIDSVDNSENEEYLW